jgi:endonuclease/exonuclease/phosphatase family metal-dependent hydrolase
VAASGAGEWDGSLEFKRAEFSDKGRGNTAQVLKATKADILALIEAEDLPTLRAFDTNLLGSKYKHEVLIDAFDPRGIDVGLYSKYPLGRIRTHMFEKVGSSRIFSRDCLEVEVVLPDNQPPVYMLLNHFKSKGYDDGTADAKRTRQAERVKEILKGYNLTQDRVVVAGDFNDTPDSAPLAALLGVPHLHDVLGLQFGADKAKRWTYHYRSFEQIDFVLVSEPLKAAFKEAGVIRQGIFGLQKLTSPLNSGVAAEQEYATVTAHSNQASDHGAVWARFEL